MNQLIDRNGNTANGIRVYGPHACPWCEFGFSMQVLLEIHLEKCDEKHLGSFCNGCGGYIRCSDEGDLQQHMIPCLALYLEDHDSPRTGFESKRKKQVTLSSQSTSDTKSSDNARIKELEEDLQVRAAELESLTDLMRANPDHAKSVIYDNFESAALKLEALYREARTDWLQRTEQLKAIKAASCPVQNSFSVKKEGKQ